MAIIKKVRGFAPQMGKNCFIAENATIVGNLVCGDDCSFWFQSVVRADVNAIRMGNKVNVQDGAIIHCTYEQAATTIGNNVSIGHRAIVHGCTIGNDVLIGMGAIVMDNVNVPDNVLIAAGAVVLENSQLEPNSIYAGVPAKKVKTLSPERFQDTVRRISDNYVMYASWFEEENNIKITVQQGDITKVQTDAIVNAANTSLLGGGGVDGAIHRAGGNQILEECKMIRARQGGCKVGEAVITNAGNLPTQKVIHTVGPRWNEGKSDETEKLKNCYINSLQLAEEHQLATIAFPNISTGIYRFPKAQAAKIAIETVQRYKSDVITEIVFVCYDAENYQLYKDILG